MVVVGNAEERGSVVINYVITTNSVVHSRPRFHSYGWGWIPDSHGLDSGCQGLDSKFQSLEFLIPNAKNWRISDSGFPYMGRKLSTVYLKVFRYSFFGTIPHFLNQYLSLLLVRSTWNFQNLLLLDWNLAWFTFYGNRYFHDNDKQKSSKTVKLKFCAIPDFTLKSKYQHLKLWRMANKIYKNKKILYVCFEVNHKNTSNLSFCLVIVNAPKNNQCFDETARTAILLQCVFYLLFNASKVLLKLVFAISRTNCFSKIIRVVILR